MDGPQHLRAAGHPGHGLDEDVQVLLQPLDDLHGLGVVLAQGSQSLLEGGKRGRKEASDEKWFQQEEPSALDGEHKEREKGSGCCSSDG